MSLPLIQPLSPGRIMAHLLIRELGSDLGQYIFVDFCAGAGGPTPILEDEINSHLRRRNEAPVQFVLTDLHPNLDSWESIVRRNPHVTYESEPVDASRAPPQLVRRDDGKKLMRLFNLSFHHFDDPLAKDILRDTVKTSQGFAIFELQSRTIESFITIILLPLVAMLISPFHAWKHRSPAALIFTWVIPVIPLVLIWDGWVSALRTREPDEVEALLRSCGADTSGWEIKNGRHQHLWPIGYIDWIVCRPVEEK